MKLIKTADGLLITQCRVSTDKHESVAQVMDFMYGYFAVMLGTQAPTRQEVENDVQYAVDYMTKTGDTIAEFGALGSFMYTTQEEVNGEF